MTDQSTLTINPTYADLLTHAGVDILATTEFGAYQGDYLFAVRQDGRHGIAIVGYGSCSGCDELENLLSSNWHWKTWPDEEYRKVTEFAHDLAGRIDWGDKRHLTEKLLGPDSYMRWYRHEKDFEAKMQQVLAAIPDGE